MNVFDSAMEMWKFNRGRTLATLKAISELPDPQAVLAWRPGAGRAHLAWQFMHIGITEELFATERLRNTPAAWPDLVPRFKGGSTPDEQIPSLSLIQQTLDQSRDHLLATIRELTTDDLGTIPEAFKERGWTIETVLKVIAWHEPHHQGQAHITLNLWKAAHAI